MRLFVFLSVPFVLLLSLLLLLGDGWRTPTVQAQAVDAASDRYLFLPIIAKPSKPPKYKSGIHLGNRDSSDWRIELFEHITGTVAGTWPSAVVIQSDQVYRLYRYSTGQCRIVAAGVKLTGEGKPYNVYTYLAAAAKAGTIVVIRITPSPGNFIDYTAPGALPHTLMHTTEPAGGNYCDERAVGGHSTDDKVRKYRDILDIAQEMQAIYLANVQDGWPPGSFFFEPANEPNQEWYAARKPITDTLRLVPDVNHKDAWIDMDNYFAALYDTAKALNPALQILSPSLSQELYGEHYRFGSCYKLQVQGDSQNRSGIDFMKKTFGYDSDAANQLPTPKADGFAWHNYWRAGHEAWADIEGQTPTLDVPCFGKALTDTATVIASDHFIQYLPEGMLAQIGPRPTFITEADLKSPCQLGETGAAVTKDASPAAIRDSLLTFIAEENFARHVIAWLLINQERDEATICRVGDAPNGSLYHNYEQNWHEAYGEDENRVYERAWFRLWWQAAW